MGGLLLKLQNFKLVKLIFGHPVFPKIGSTEMTLTTHD